ncbi:uncharacterized protein LOC123389281 [Mustela putorius furo]|uniref:Uncharacterized protein LOC123389281 n=1 Tax=Mustela putorius furo TaxID=9669 RepID=A0A8U0RP24_MUSPF|nr:uncharacterized protein LOC123389281 [Mustela putorius furo]
MTTQMVSKSDDDLKIMLNRITLRPNAGVCAGISIPRSLGALEGRCPWELEAKHPPGIPAPALETGLGRQVVGAALATTDVDRLGMGANVGCECQRPDTPPSPREDLALTTKSGFSQPRPKGPCLGSPGHGAVPTAPSDSSPGARASPSSSPRVLRRAWPARSSVCRHAAENRIHTRGDRPHQLVLPGPALPTGPMSQDPGSWRSPPRSPAGLGRQVVGAALATTEPRPPGRISP